MRFYIDACLDFDLGNSYIWNDGTLQLHGSWCWDKPFPAMVSVRFGRFYGFAAIDVPFGVYEYKWSFSGKEIVGTHELYHTTQWFNDCSGRPVWSHHHNQLLRLSDMTEYAHSVLQDADMRDTNTQLESIATLPIEGRNHSWAITSLSRADFMFHLWSLRAADVCDDWQGDTV